ncbi:MAG: hypothetical protein ACFFA6_08540 [Promethearchaeota archaeon]
MFDFVKARLNEILIKGIESISQQNYSDFLQLKKKLKNMHLGTLKDLLKNFIKGLEKLKTTNNLRDVKFELAIMVLKIITVTRMYERIMTLEVIKKNLLSIKN